MSTLQDKTPDVDIEALIQNEDAGVGLDKTKSKPQPQDPSVPLDNPRSLDPVCCFKTAFILFFTALCSPFIICDLYYAYTDTSCVHNATKHTTVNLFSYLAVSGFFNLSVLLVYICGFCSLSSEDGATCFILVCSFLQQFFLLFSLSWVMVGAVVFWSEIDNSSCSSPVYNYMMASLIIKLAGMFIVGCAESRKKDEKR